MDGVRAGLAVVGGRCAVVCAGVVQRHVVNRQIAVDDAVANHWNSLTRHRRALHSTSIQQLHCVRH